MCGRFTLRTSPQKLLENFGVSFPEFTPRFNIAPTQLVFALRTNPEGTGRQIVALRWGLVPSWAKDLKIGAKSINARGETVAEKPMFRAALKRRRCLVVADGYYEWRAAGNVKQPYHFRYEDQRPFAFAGLWESWCGPEGKDPPLDTCTIITTAAGGVAATLHERMPVIIPPSEYDLWISPQPLDARQLEALLHPQQQDDIVPVPVSTLVNSVKNDRPECLQPVE
ncbi:MAG: SOS response-associated peptidase [Planctomycetales bacterium]|nr:SOS response-associated peptidase [Planctomycetales bacterium]